MRRFFLLASLAALPLLAACASPRMGTPQARVVFFERDDATLDDAAKGLLAEAADIANRYPETKVSVLGFANPEPTPVPGGNRELSQRRAEAVAAQLRANKVDASRITVLPLGAVPYERAPVESRRVEIKIGN